jgi:hypothetical protein
VLRNTVCAVTGSEWGIEAAGGQQIVTAISCPILGS